MNFIPFMVSGMSAAPFAATFEGQARWEFASDQSYNDQIGPYTLTPTNTPSFVPDGLDFTAANQSALATGSTHFTPWFNASEGTLVVEFIDGGAGIGINGAVFAIGDGTFNNYIAVFKTTNTTYRCRVNSGGAASFLSDFTTTVGGRHKIAFSYAANSFRAALDGTAGTLDTSGALAIAPDRLTIGAIHTGQGSSQATVALLHYYNTASDQSTLESRSTQ